MYIFEINFLSVASFAINFAHSEGCLFTLLIVSFVVQKLLSLIKYRLLIFVCFHFQYSGRWVTEDPTVICVGQCINSPTIKLSSRSFIVSGLTFRS